MITNRLSYNITLHKYGEMLYNGLKNSIMEFLVEMAETNLIAVSADDLLESITTFWRNYKIQTTMIKDINMYFERVYLGRPPSESELPSTTVEMTRILFQEYYLKHPKVKLMPNLIIRSTNI